VTGGGQVDRDTEKSAGKQRQRDAGGAVHLLLVNLLLHQRLFLAQQVQLQLGRHRHGLL